MNKKKGFTLIELLVVIAIMASILVLAITSLNGVSKAKKKEAEKKVEDQIELAAKQYVEANEYLFEGLNVTGDYDTVFIKDLISNDYLNVLTNPVTGKKYNRCDKVIVKKTNKNKFTYEFAKSDTNNCTSYSSSTVEVVPDNPKCPKDTTITAKTKSEGSGKSGWYKSNIIYTFSLIQNTKDISEKAEFEVKVNGKKIFPDLDNKNKYVIDKEGKGNVIEVTARNGDCPYDLPPLTYNLDKTKPTITYKKTNNEYAEFYDKETKIWSNKFADFSVEASDSLSGIGNVTDNNGNTAGTFYVEWNDNGKTDEYGNFTKSSFKQKDCNDGKNWECHNSTVTYKNGGLQANGMRKESYKVCDIAGNCANKTIYVNIDTDAPIVTLNRASNSEKFNYNANDNLKIAAYALSTSNSTDNLSWTSVSNQKIDGSFKVNAKKNADTQYLFVKDLAGNIGLANRKAYQYCDSKSLKNPTSYTDGTVAKIFNFKYKTANCNNSTPYVVYDFLEYQCSCYVDTVHSHNCGYDSSTNITKKTHGQNSSFMRGYTNVSVVYYKNSQNGKNSCNSRRNDYVNYVCDSNYATTDGNPFHGYKWYSGSVPSNGYNAFSPNSSGTWYHNGGNYDTGKVNGGVTSENIRNACNAACDAKYND